MTEINSEKDEKLKFTSTAPICDEKKYGVYADIMHQQVKAKNVFNVGIIAPYGAGKSSLIKTYKDTKLKCWDKNKVTTISLANFNSVEKAPEQIKQDNKEPDNKKLDEMQPIKDIDCSIEKSILEQLIFKESKSKLPHSRLKRINNVHGLSSFLIAILMTATIALTCCGVLECLKKLPCSNGCNFYYFFGFAAGSVLLLLFSLLYSNRLNRISVREIEVDICANPNFSVLNTFIDEILYFFQKTKTKIVIIEDLDRFDNTHIFSKLRELNFLINNSKIVKQKVTFIYAVKDTLFKAENDRAKFFDYIISLVPVLSFTNAYDIMKNEMKKLCPSNMLLPDSYIGEVAHFITEMRILKNVINDYMTYYKILNIKKLSIENKNIKLFSLVLYKNLRPSDFAELQFEKGKLAKLFKAKKTKINEEIKSLRDEIKNLEKKQIQVNELSLKSFEIFRSLIKGRIIDSNQSQQSNLNYTEIDTVNTFKNINGGLMFGQSVYGGYYGTVHKDYYCSVSELEKQLGDTLFNFENRVKEKAATDLSKIKEEIDEKRLIIRNLTNYTLQEYIKTHENFVSDDLSNYFLSNGYIAEDYKMFVAHADQDLLTSQDNNFVLAVLAKRPINYAIKLDKPLNVIQEIQPERFSDKYVLNYDLVACLLDYNDKDKDFISKKDSLVKYLTSRETSAKEFIKHYINDKNDVCLLIKTLAPLSQYFICDILNDKEISDNNKATAIYYLFENFKIDAITKQNYKNVITDFLNNYENVIDEISIANEITFIDVATSFDLEIRYLKCSQNNYSIANQLACHALYALNGENLEFIIRYLKNIEIERYYSAPLTVIFDTQDEGLISYISANLSDIINLILKFENQTHESQAAFEFILKCDEVSIDLCKKFIDKQSGYYNYFENIDKEILQYLFDNEKVATDWVNIVTPLNKGLINFDVAIKFIFDNACALGEQHLDNKNFILELCNNIKYDAQKDYENLKDLSKAFSASIIANDINDDFVCSVMIENDKIQTCETEFLSLTSKPLSIVKMILKNNSLSNLVTTSNFRNAIIEEVILNNELQNKIIANILKNSGYIPYQQEAIVKVKNVLISNPINNCSGAIVDKIMSNQDISESDKLKFIGNNDSKLSFDKYMNMLAYIVPQLSNLRTERSIKLNYDEISKDILIFLVNKNLCGFKEHLYGIKITRKA